MSSAREEELLRRCSLRCRSPWDQAGFSSRRDFSDWIGGEVYAVARLQPGPRPCNLGVARRGGRRPTKVIHARSASSLDKLPAYEGASGFSDIRPDNAGNSDQSRSRRRWGETAGLLPSTLRLPEDMTAFGAERQGHDLGWLEDACRALRCHRSDRATRSQLTQSRHLSLYANKQLTRGGRVLATPDQEIARSVQERAQQGRAPDPTRK